MATRAGLVTLAFLFFHGAAVAAVTAGGSPQHLREVRSFLKWVNKAPLTSVKSPDGDIIDCVPISKQPALDNPLLKNHTIQMRPSYHPGDLYDNSNNVPHPITQTWQQNGKCRENTVPIRRTKEDDVMRARSVNWYGKKSPESLLKLHPVSDDVTSGHQHAVAASVKDKYHGTKITINLGKPMTETVQHFSLTQLWITAGSYGNNDLNTIEAGWQVYSALYGDANPRLFIYWTRDAYQKTGCYNLLCSGFVQTNHQIAIGGSLSPQSVYGGSQYDFDILVRKDPKGGNWWLQVGSTSVDYWSSSIFTYLKNSASSVQWGGEVYSPPGAGQTSTQMSSGHFPSELYGKASCIKNIQEVDSSNVLRQANGLGLIEAFPNCYRILNGTSNEWGTYIFYGGPGRNSKCP